MFLLLFAGGTAQGQFQFVDVSATRGIQAYTMAPGMAGGIAAADFDDDGDIDLFVPNAEGIPDQLYRNLGDGHFEEIAASAGLASTMRSRAALWFDYDGDHKLDLFVSGDCFGMDSLCTGVSTLKLYRQVGEAQWQDVTQQAGLTDDLVWFTGQHRGGAAAGDVNNDGYLDLVTGLWSGEARLFVNNGDGTFADMSATSGLGGTAEGHWQPVMHDFDHDGWLDIFYAIDFTANQFWINQADTTLLDMASTAGVDSTWNDMGVTLGDYDNDGDFDIYITEIFELGRHNRLYRNDSSVSALQFTDVAEEAGVENTSFGWGTTFFDADNNGWLDLAATNGYFNPAWEHDPSRFFLNDGGDPVTFIDVSDSVGFNDTEWGSSLIALDFDRDGDLDLVQTCSSGPLRLLENQRSGAAAENNYLVIKPRTSGPNGRAIGAVVRVSIGGLDLRRLITAGTSLMGQEPAEAFFGVGSATIVDEVVVEWPDGTQTIVRGVPTNQMLTLEPAGCSGGDIDCNGVVGIGDLFDLFAAWGTCPGGTATCLGDLDGNGFVALPDFMALFAYWGG